MADPVTSGINLIDVGEGKDKKTIFTGTKVTPTTGSDGNKTYKIEIIQYDNGLGEGGKVIGKRDPNNPDLVLWNDDYPDELWSDGDATEAIKQQSQSQAEGIQGQVATTQAEKQEFNKSNASPNKGNESENEQKDLTLSSVQAGVDAVAKAGESVTGTRKGGFGVHVFPNSLRKDADGQDYLKFDMLQYKAKKFNSDNFSFSGRGKLTDRESIGTVILPIPGGIQDSQQVNWGGQSMTPLDMAKANIALTGVRDGFSAAISETGNMANNIASSFGDNKDALAAVIAGMAAGGQQLLTRTTGAIANPNMELLFNGPDLRTFSFQFLLAPRNKKEAMDVIQIIRFFKQGMAPIRTKSRLFMKSPHTFRLSYRNSKGTQHKYLNKFKECALGSFGVNYAPNGNYSTYEDGVMTAYQMTMNYRELNPIYNDDYGEDTPFPAEIGF